MAHYYFSGVNVRKNAGLWKFRGKGLESREKRKWQYFLPAFRKFRLKMALFSDPETRKAVENELEIVKKTLSEKIEGSEIISCHPVAVNVRIT